MEQKGIRDSLLGLRNEVFSAAVKSGRSHNDIKIIAVTKNVSLERMKEAVQEGMLDLGENRVQDLLAKQPHFGPGITWHHIGHLQTNKVRSVVGRVSMIHSLDSWRLACEIDRRSKEMGIVSSVLVQVNASGEKSKYGLNPTEVFDFVKAAQDMPGLSIRGLMTIAPLVDDSEEVRPFFRELKQLYDFIRHKLPVVPLAYLSMGMSNDYCVAVEEGANLLRLGTAIFGSRG